MCLGGGEYNKSRHTFSELYCALQLGKILHSTKEGSLTHPLLKGSTTSAAKTAPIFWMIHRQAQLVYVQYITGYHMFNMGHICRITQE